MIINGKELASSILQKNLKRVQKFETKPKLVVITIGDDPASNVYVNNKRKAAEQVGLEFEQIKFSETTSYHTILEALVNSNCFAYNVAGIIIQLPIVSSVLTEQEKKVLTQLISTDKDVDGFVPESKFTPCTPKGVMCMLESIPNLDLSGKTALVIGRSNIVGKPLAKLLLDKNCTVIQAHSRTPKDVLCRLFSISDIVVSAVGKPDIISTDDAEQYWKDNRTDFYGDFTNKLHRVIIDVGINRVDGKLCGDFSEEFKSKYSDYYSPVPNGVGPMTVAMLIDNTVEAWEELQQNR